MRVALIAIALSMVPSVAMAQSIKVATFGCKDWDVYKSILTMHAQGDTAAATKLYARSMISGICHNFEAGDRVLISEGAFTAAKVRKRGELDSYWVAIEHVSTH